MLSCGTPRSPIMVSIQMQAMEDMRRNNSDSLGCRVQGYVIVSCLLSSCKGVDSSPGIRVGQVFQQLRGLGLRAAIQPTVVFCTICLNDCVRTLELLNNYSCQVELYRIPMQLLSNICTKTQETACVLRDHLTEHEELFIQAYSKHCEGEPWQIYQRVFMLQFML